MINDTKGWQVLLQQLLQEIDIRSMVSLLLSGVGGVITFQLSDRQKAKKRNKKLQDSSLDEVYLPLMKILYSDDPKASIDRISDNCKIIDEKFQSKVLYIPPEHIRQIKVLRYYLRQYRTEGDVWLKPIYRQYKRMSRMIDKYSNYLKKVSGFPYESTYINYCSTSYSPRFSIFNMTLLIILWLTIYAVFLIFDEPVSAAITAFVPITIYMLVKYGGRSIRKKGGIKVLLFHGKENATALIHFVLNKINYYIRS